MGKKQPKFLRLSNLEGLDEEVHKTESASLTSDVDIDDAVGREIKLLRKARGKTLTDLSKETSLSQGYLSQIERGVSSPSVKALHSISRALGVTISWFFSRNDPDGDLKDLVVRAGNRRKLSYASGITDELLSPDLGGALELLRCTFKPGAKSGEKPYIHQGEEAGVIIKGELHLWIGDQHVVLNEGDSFAFSSDTPHRYANPTDHEAVAIWSITPPTY